MALTQEQIDQIRDAQQAYVEKRLPRAVREARRRSLFERTGTGNLRRKSSNPRRWKRRMLYMEARRETLPLASMAIAQQAEAEK